MKRTLALVLALMMALSLAACGGKSGGTAQTPPPAAQGGDSAAPADTGAEQEPVTIQMTYPPSSGATSDLEMQWVREKVLEATDGKVTFELYPGSSLATDKVALDSIMTGTLDSAGITCNSIAQTIPEFNTRCLPFCFDSVEHFWAVVSDPEYKAGVQEILDQYDLVYLGNSGNALRGFGTTREVHTPDDIKGMKVRIMDGTIYQDMYSLWGFGTSSIAFGEVYTAIQQGVVDGCDIDLNAMEFMAIGEVAPFYLETYQVMHGLAHIISKDTWNRVTPENQAKIMDIFAQMEDGVSYEIWKEYYEKSEKVMEEWNVKVSVVTDEEFALWKDASQPIYDKYKDVIGADYYDSFMALVDKHR